LGSAPSAGEEGQDQAEGPSPGPPDEDWDAFERAFTADGVPIMRVSLARQVWAALDAGERKRATAAAQGYVASRGKQAKPAAKVAAQTFLRERDAWEKFAALSPAEPVQRHARRFVPEGSAHFAGLSVAHRIATGNFLDARPVGSEGGQRGALTLASPFPDLLALAPFAGDVSGWVELDAANPDDKAKIAAWRRAVAGWTGWHVDTRKAPKIGADGRPEISRHEALGRVYELPVFREVLLVPAPWPPRRDGTFAEAGEAAGAA
jgi:hypothetical protein